MADERDESARAVIFVCVAFLRFNHAHQPLRFACRADRDDETPVRLQLREQGFGHFGAACRHEYSIIRRMRAPAERPVKAFDGRIVDAQLAYARLRLARQLRDALDGKDLRAETCEHGGLITGASPDLQHAAPRIKFEQLGHPRDDERLRDGLIGGYWQRVIAVGAALQCFGHETVARHKAHRIEHTNITYPIMIA